VPDEQVGRTADADEERDERERDQRDEADPDAGRRDPAEPEDADDPERDADDGREREQRRRPQRDPATRRRAERDQAARDAGEDQEEPAAGTAGTETTPSRIAPPNVPARIGSHGRRPGVATRPTAPTAAPRTASPHFTNGPRATRPPPAYVRTW
jgi:hypothetical protein